MFKPLTAACTAVTLCGIASAQQCWGQASSRRSAATIVEDRPYTGWHEGKYWVNGRESAPPEDAPPDPDAKTDPATKSDPTETPLTGVIADKLASVERATIEGREISVQQLKDALKGEIPDDSKKLRIVVKGKDAERLGRDWYTDEKLKQCRDKYVFQPFLGPHWQAEKYADGVTFVLPSGEVLARGEYTTADDLVRGLESYDPSKDKPLTKPAKKSGVGIGVWVLAGIAAMILLNRNKEV